MFFHVRCCRSRWKFSESSILFFLHNWSKVHLRLTASTYHTFPPLNQIRAFCCECLLEFSSLNCLFCRYPQLEYSPSRCCVSIWNEQTEATVNNVGALFTPLHILHTALRSKTYRRRYRIDMLAPILGSPSLSCSIFLPLLLNSRVPELLLFRC